MIKERGGMIMYIKSEGPSMQSCCCSSLLLCGFTGRYSMESKKRVAGVRKVSSQGSAFL